jgi:hypothetical protein
MMNLLFAPTSRYAATETATIEDAEGKVTIYLRRRFLPPPELFSLVCEHVVTQGERLDNITARYIDDPEQFWRLCDANRAMRPNDLTARIGRRLRITLPEGVPGAGND